MRLRYIFVVLWSSLYHAAAQQLSLLYPPARWPPLDFRLTGATDIVCGVPRSRKNASPPQFRPGDMINATWSIANAGVDTGRSWYNTFELLDASGSTIFRWYNTVVSGKLGDRSRSAQLVIPVVSEYAKFYTLSVKSGIRGYTSTLQTCADIYVADKKNFVEKCSEHGSYKNGACSCSGSYMGDRCQFEQDCLTDTDCNFHGTCENLSPETTEGDYKCFCKPGWYGKTCELASELTAVPAAATYPSAGLDVDSVKLYWRHIDDEIEFMVESKGDNDFAIGMKSAAPPPRPTAQPVLSPQEPPSRAGGWAPPPMLANFTLPSKVKVPKVISAFMRTSKPQREITIGAPTNVTQIAHAETEAEMRAWHDQSDEIHRDRSVFYLDLSDDPEGRPKIPNRPSVEDLLSVGDESVTMKVSNDPVLELEVQSRSSPVLVPKRPPPPPGARVEGVKVNPFQTMPLAADPFSSQAADPFAAPPAAISADPFAPPPARVPPQPTAQPRAPPRPASRQPVEASLRKSDPFGDSAWGVSSSDPVADPFGAVDPFSTHQATEPARFSNTDPFASASTASLYTADSFGNATAIIPQTEVLQSADPFAEAFPRTSQPAEHAGTIPMSDPFAVDPFSSPPRSDAPIDPFSPPGLAARQSDPFARPSEAERRSDLFETSVPEPPARVMNWPSVDVPEPDEAPPPPPRPSPRGAAPVVPRREVPTIPQRSGPPAPPRR